MGFHRTVYDSSGLLVSFFIVILYKYLLPGARIPQDFFVTTIKEVSDKNFGIGGKTIDKVKEEYRKNH